MEAAIQIGGYLLFRRV